MLFYKSTTSVFVTSDYQWTKVCCVSRQLKTCFFVRFVEFKWFFLASNLFVWYLFVSGSTEELQYAKSDRIAADVFTPDTTSLPSFSFFQIVPDIFSSWLLFLNPRTVVTRQSVTCGFGFHATDFFMWLELKGKVKWKILHQMCIAWCVISVWCSMHAKSYTLSYIPFVNQNECV